MSLLSQKVKGIIEKTRLLFRLNKIIDTPCDANDIIRTKQQSNQLILRYLIRDAQKSFSSPQCLLNEVSFEIKIPSPVSFNIKDKIHLLYLNPGLNDQLIEIIRRFSSTDTAFVDIGSNIGFYAYLYQGMGENNTVFVFEPNPSLIQHLKTNLKRDSANIFEIALSDETGNIQFFYDANSTGRGSLERDWFSKEILVFLLGNQKRSSLQPSSYGEFPEGFSFLLDGIGRRFRGRTLASSRTGAGERGALRDCSNIGTHRE